METSKALSRAIHQVLIYLMESGELESNFEELDFDIIVQVAESSLQAEGLIEGDIDTRVRNVIDAISKRDALVQNDDLDTLRVLTIDVLGITPKPKYVGKLTILDFLKLIDIK